MFKKVVTKISQSHNIIIVNIELSKSDQSQGLDKI